MTHYKKTSDPQVIAPLIAPPPPPPSSLPLLPP